MNKLLPILLAFLFCGQLHSQDIHWTQFERAPLQLNPARTGDFYGTARLTAIARLQSNSIANTGFFTYAFSVDAPIIKGLRENDWVGVGLNFATDKAGTLELGIKSQSFSGSYHYAVDKKARTYLTLGVQIESYGRKVGNSEAAEFRDGTKMSLNESPDFQNATGYTAGLQLATALNQRTKLRIGGKFGRIGRVNVGLGQNSRYRVPNRISLHADLDIQTGPKTRFIPQLLYENYGTASVMVLQGRAKYLLDKEKKIDISGGLGYRFGDALQVLFGLSWGDIDIGIGYDLPVSGQASEAVPLGGLELGISYIMKIFKEPQVDPVIFCPRF
jgi:type IX secretion system PorP/SprF family membrane protein